MSIPKRTDYENFQNAVRTAKNELDAPTIAILSGPAVVIEAVVRKAEEESGIPMDWGYIGGRAIVRANGNVDEARLALAIAMPRMLNEDHGRSS